MHAICAVFGRFYLWQPPLLMDVCWFVYEISHRRWEAVGFGGHRQPL